MRNNIVLIDFENVQPLALDALAQPHFRVLVFVGANQTKVPFDTAAAVQKLGAQAEYVKIAGNGPNALDFHIAYYIGALSATDPNACFHIVSKDAGFDPLIQHLKTRKVRAGRVTEIADIPALKAAHSKTPEERMQIVLDRLAQPNAPKPRTVKTLSNSIASYLQKQATEEEIAALVQALVASGAISMVGTKVNYALATHG
ncbi:MAG: PIN domain-containing protein [Serpentinimonas sp.]|jgi:hypothetical protein|nr:PIN domain-containing protein [Serpentinimonas sp.]